jgi:hypothetical protein
MYILGAEGFISLLGSNDWGSVDNLRLRDTESGGALSSSVSDSGIEIASGS